MYIHQNSLECP